MRGGPDSAMLDKQEDSVQDHTHGVHDPGHDHAYVDNGIYHGGQWATASYLSKIGDIFDSTHWTRSNNSATNIVIKNVVGARTDSETRPKNLAVVFIMKVF